MGVVLKNFGYMMNFSKERQETSLSIELARMFPPTVNSLLVLPCFVAVLSITMNSVQLWFLRAKFRREMNPLFLLIWHLCIADLLAGVQNLSFTLLGILEGNIITDVDFTENLHHVIHFVGPTCATYVFTVSTVTLDGPTVLKVLKIIKNRSYRKVTVKRVCYCTWGVAFIGPAINYILYQAKVSQVSDQMAIQVIYITILTYSSVFLQSYCLGRISCATRLSMRKVPERADGTTRSKGRFLKIAVFQILAFGGCELALPSYLMMVKFTNINSENTLLACFRGLIYLHSVVDPIVFFVVYRHKWRPKRPNLALGFDGRTAYVIPTPRLDSCNNQMAREDLKNDYLSDYSFWV